MREILSTFRRVFQQNRPVEDIRYFRCISTNLIQSGIAQDLLNTQ